MGKCIKCGRTLSTDARYCPYCGNPVSFYEEKKQPATRFSANGMPPAISPIAPAQPVSRKQGRGRIALILTIIVLSGLLIASFVFAITLWSVPARLAASPGSLDFGTLQAGSQDDQILTLSNTGRQDLDWRAVKGTADWLTLDPAQGRILSGGSQIIHVRADTALLTAGHYSASISFISNGGEASVSAVLTVASGPASTSGPAVSSIEPTAGPASGGTNVTIRGSGFTGASHVLFGATAVDHFTVKSDTQITAVSPAGSGTVHVTVITPGATTPTSDADRFTYQAAPPASLLPPKIASIQPARGLVTGGTTVIIRGSGFTGATRVLFGTTASTFTVNSDTRITAVSPVGRGTVHVTVITPGGTTAASSHDQFTYLISPKIARIEPTSGPTTGGTKVTIRGGGFTRASHVLFGTTAASNYTVNSDTQITAVSPAGSGTVHVAVITPVGTTAASNADQFTYLAVPPRIASVEPTSGPATGGTSVIIRGSGFTRASRVLFGTTTASTFTVNSNVKITATSPAGSGTVSVTVITPVGTTAASDVGQFTYQAAPPKITSIDPKEGSADGGTKVTIRGSGFTGTTQVWFGGTAASTFTVISDTQITAVSPAGSGTVYVTVSTAVGTTAASGTDQFQYR